MPEKESQETVARMRTVFVGRGFDYERFRGRRKHVKPGCARGVEQHRTERLMPYITPCHSVHPCGDEVNRDSQEAGAIGLSK